MLIYSSQFQYLIIKLRFIQGFFMLKFLQEDHQIEYRSRDYDLSFLVLSSLFLSGLADKGSGEEDGHQVVAQKVLSRNMLILLIQLMVILSHKMNH